MSDVVCNINGTNYSGWTSVDITISMQSLAGIFNLGLTDDIRYDGRPVRSSSKEQSISYRLKRKSCRGGVVQNINFC